MNGSYLSSLIQRQAATYGDRVALKYRDYATASWMPVSWKQFEHFVLQTARALVALKVGVQENIGVFSQNKPECFYVDFGAFCSRVATVPMYATSSEVQIHYILNDAGIRILFVGEQYQYDIARRVQSIYAGLEQIVIFDKSVKRAEGDTQTLYYDEFLKMGDSSVLTEEVETRRMASSSDDIANILYTSGTTGESKGVMLHHSCYETAIPAHQKRLYTFSDKDVVVNFLPLTHIFERAWAFYCLSMGATLCVNLIPQDIQKTIKEVRPTAMCSVPRFWEKVYSGVLEKIEETKGLRKVLMLDAIKTGKAHNIDCLINGKQPSLWLKLKYKFYEKTIYSLLKKTIGIENGNFFPTAGAAIPLAVEEFVHSVGIPMIAGYGLTETTATVSCEFFGDIRLGSVGRPLPTVEVKFGENDEILLKGGSVTRGYYKKEQANIEGFTEDGWFRTGDAGYMDKDGFLFLTDRIKDLFKTSNGKFIAPQAIETKLVVDKYIDQISIIADKRKYVSALIVPEYRLVEQYAHEHQIRYTDIRDLLAKPEIQELFKKRIDALQQQFAHYEHIKRFTLLSTPFSMERGELTNTLKIKRKVLQTNYAKEIEAMYEE